jgi:hypothetical protein
MRRAGMQYTPRRNEKWMQNFSRETWREEAIWDTPAEDNIKTGVNDIGSESVDWIHQAQDRPVEGSFQHG